MRVPVYQDVRNKWIAQSAERGKPAEAESMAGRYHRPIRIQNGVWQIFKCWRVFCGDHSGKAGQKMVVQWTINGWRMIAIRARKRPYLNQSQALGRPVQRAQNFLSWCAYHPAHIKNKAAFLTRENGIPKPFGTLIYLLSLRRRKNKSQQARKISFLPYT